MNGSPPQPSRLLKVSAACAKWALGLLAGCCLLLALAWGALHGWIVPRIADYRPAMERQASQALGVPVRIGHVSAHETGLVPSVELQDVELMDPQGHAALRLPRIVVSLSPRALWNRGFDQLFIDSPELDVRRAADGRIYVAGLDLSSGERGDGSGADWFFRQGEFAIRGGTLRWTDEMRNAPELGLTDVDLVVRNGARSHEMRIDATPPGRWGERFTIMGSFRQPLLSTHPGRWQHWNGELFADFRRVDLKELRRHARLGVDMESGHGAVRAWADVADGQVVGGTADIAVADVVTRLGADLAPLGLASLSGRIGGKWRTDGFDFEARDLQFVTDQGQRWPGGNLSISWTEGDGKAPAAGELKADRLDLAALRQLGGRLPLGRPTHAALAAYAPEGLVENVQARWQGDLRAPQKYQAKGRVSGLHVAAGGATRRPDGRVSPGSPGVRNATLDFDVSEGGGSAKLAMQGGALEFPGVFEEPVLPFDRLVGDLQWQFAGDRLTVTANGIKFSNADAQGEMQASWHTGDDAAHRYPGLLDLTASLGRANGARVWRYLPLSLPASAREYVRDSVQQADVTEARARVKGDLRAFPFGQARSGEFRITAQVRDATYAFAPHAPQRAAALPWPVLTQLSGQLVFDRTSMRVEDAQARLNNAPGLRVRAEAAVADLAHTSVDVTGEVRGPLAEALGVVQHSAINALMQDALGRATATGNTQLQLKLALPIAQIERSTVLGTVTLANNDVQITPDTPTLGRAKGTVTFNERGFSLQGTQARALGGDVRLEGGTRSGGIDNAIVVRAQGNATAEGLRQARELGFLARLARHATGGSAYAMTLTFRKAVPEILVTSNLQGLALNLPAPLAKTSDAVLPLRFENALLRDSATTTGQADQLSVDLGRIASVNYVRDLAGREPRVLRGAIALGLAPGETAALPEQGVTANIALGPTDVDAWQQVLNGLSAGNLGPLGGAVAGGGGAASGYMPTVIAVRAKAMTVQGRTLHNLVVGGGREGLLWRANVDADEMSGYLEYREPSGAGAGRVYGRLARLSIAAAAATAVETLLDEQPANIPALDVMVDDFDLRGRKLGRLEIDAVNRGAGAVQREGGVREWRLNRLSLTTPEAAFTATGNWAAVDSQGAGPRSPERRRTVMNFRLDVGDAGGLLSRLGMKDIVRAGQGRMEGQIAWLGSPLGLDYPSMTGAFHVDIDRGQFLKADPGLAKLLGVLSLQALPRRLSLDFRDVFTEGFAFDFVRGDITIQEGIAATNNLQMKGVNAAVAMEGKADLARETQDLHVVVVPEINAGTASLVAAAINPAIGLGTFLAQMFLRQPLARAATQQFQIDGTWADPRITKLVRQQPADTRGASNN